MRVLVNYASRFGGTREIAEAIARTLDDAGVRVRCSPVQDAPDLERFDAFVIGSAVYFGRWLPAATDFVRTHAGLLVHRPTWLFSSGPLPVPAGEADEALVDETEPEELPALRDLITPRGHVVFAGTLQPQRLRLRDRALRTLPAGRAALPAGDFREWDRIEGWAASIAQQLDTPSSDVPVPPSGTTTTDDLW